MSFEVTSYADLKKVGTGVDGWTLGADYIQTADIDASASATENPNGSGGYYGFVPIGTFAIPFEGSYDGQGHTISNLYINRSSTAFVGLFGCNRGTVKNFGNINSNIVGRNYSGGFCGHNAGEISNCYSTGSVSGDNAVGGFCGYNYGTISNCYSTSSANGNYDIGGFCGYSHYGTITNCYSTGSISGIYYVGGFCGYNYYGTITNCYWNTETSGQSTSAGGEGRTTDEMTYPYADNTYVNWNFETIWKADIENENNGYPRLFAFITSYVITLQPSNVETTSCTLRGRVML